MEWFQGDIKAAIAQCQQQRAVFIVYIKDTSDATTQTDTSWDSFEVLKVTKVNSHVAIQIMKDSVEYHQFSQLFPVLMTPCVFCIGLAGEQLVVRNGALNSNALAQSLNEAFNKHNNVVLGPSETHVAQTPSEMPDGQTHSEPSVAQTPSESPVGQTTSEMPVAQTPSEMPVAQTPSGASIDEQTEIYRKKMQENRKKREEERREKEKEDEKRRIKEGKQMDQWKKDQKEREQQDWLKERRKQKLEEQKARKEILDKLEQDKRERLSKKMEKQREKDISPQPSSGASVKRTSSTGTARVQAKLPDSHTEVFILSSSDTVLTLRNQISEYMDVNEVSIHSVYPHKELGSDLDDTTLEENGLSPSGVVIVRTKGYKSSSNPGSSGSIMESLWFGIAGFFGLILSVLIYIKDSFVGLFVGNPNNPTTPTTTTTTNKTGRPTQSRDGPRVRRFNQDDFKDDDDDENRTYNGNSTQQF